MSVIKNMKIVHKVFKEKLHNHKFDRFDLLFFSFPNNMKDFYIGSKEDNTETLFKHSDTDECYYDVLSKNEMYYDDLEKLYQVDSENYCTNLKSLKELVKTYKKGKEVIL